MMWFNINIFYFIKKLILLKTKNHIILYNGYGYLNTDKIREGCKVDVQTTINTDINIFQTAYTKTDPIIPCLNLIGCTIGHFF